MYAQLSSVSTARLESLLEAGGKMDKIAGSRTWPLQARLLFEGKLEALTRLQDGLKDGRSADDLTLIEGIGPKTQEFLMLSGIFTFSDLAQQTAEALGKILVEGGEPYRLADPTTWPYQAQLAAAGEHEALERLQSHLSGGQPVENLTAVEGIGPKIQQLLWQANIFTFEQLAAASVHRLKELLATAGEPYHMATPDSWPEQAQLAAGGKWADLEELKERLKGGRTAGSDSQKESLDE
jgi:predicted flap endonuclease-1-like 5' DNA nuclease